MKYLFIILLLASCQEYYQIQPYPTPDPGRERDMSDEQPVKLIIKNEDWRCKEYNFNVYVTYTLDSLEQWQNKKSNECTCEIIFPIEKECSYQISNVRSYALGDMYNPTFSVQVLNSKDVLMYSNSGITMGSLEKISIL